MEGKALRLVFKAARIAGCTGRRGEGELGENGEGLGLSQGRGEGLRRECPRGSAAKAGVGLLEGGSGRVGQLSGARPRSDENKADASLTLPRKYFEHSGGRSATAQKQQNESAKRGEREEETENRAAELGLPVQERHGLSWCWSMSFSTVCCDRRTRTQTGGRNRAMHTGKIA